MKRRNLKLFFLHEALFYFSDSMLAIVLPVFIYKLFGTASAVFLFYAIWNAIYLLLIVPLFNKAMMSGKPKYMMIMGVLFYIAMQMIFSKTGAENRMLFIPGTICFGLYVSCYWMVRHWFFSVNADYEKIGKQVSYIWIIRLVIGLIGPIVGGWLSYAVSFNATFILGTAAAIISIIPILLFNAPPHPRGYDWKKVKRILNKPELKSIRPAYFWEGITTYLTNTCWILAFAIFLGNIKQFGTMVGITTLVAVLLTRLSDHMFDKGRRGKILSRFTELKSLGTLFYASIFLFPKLSYAWVADLFNKFAGNLHQTFIDSYLFGHSSKIHPIHFHLNREIHLSGARVISSVILALFFLFLPEEFLWLGIFIGSFTLFGWLYLKRGEHLLRSEKDSI
jgi:hypothetical protein